MWVDNDILHLWKERLEVVESALKIVAIPVAGAWTYFQFFRGRTLRHRLELEVTTTPTLAGTRVTLNTAMQVKNVGLSKVPIEQVGTAVRVFEYRDAGASHPGEVQWERIRTVECFKKHAWVEPSESIKEQVLLSIPWRNQQAFKVEMRIVSTRLEWNASSVATFMPPPIQSSPGEHME